MVAAAPSSGTGGPGTGPVLTPAWCVVLALHWQVNVVRPEGFFGPMLAEPVRASGVVPRARRFHEEVRAAGVRLAFTRFTVPPGGGDLVPNTDFMLAVSQNAALFAPDAPGAQLVDDVGYDPARDLVSDNQRLSALSASRLAQRLVDFEITTVLLTGVATNLVVEQTARAATDLGFSVHVVSDCVAAADDAAHAASMANLQLTTAGSLTSAEVLDRLQVAR